jgi:hypothetical protein
MMKAMTYNYPEEIPVAVWATPAIWMEQGNEMVRLAREYPEFFAAADIPDLNRLSDYMPPSYRLGETVDEWGCVWSNVHEGMEALVTGHPVPNREDIMSLQIPDRDSGNVPHGFMYMRLLDLRGFMEVMIDFAEECEELQVLIDKVLTYNCRQIAVKLKKSADADYLVFGDDLGMQRGMAIGADKWRKYLKPCYQKMYRIVHEAGKKVYMHSDGDIVEIIPDLAECGVDMINPQFRANGLQNLVRVCKGKIPVHLDLDRQLFPFATPAELDEHVRECVEAFYLPAGGFAIYIELTCGIPLDNAAALLEAARKYRHWR